MRSGRASTHGAGNHQNAAARPGRAGRTGAFRPLLLGGVGVSLRLRWRYDMHAITAQALQRLAQLSGEAPHLDAGPEKVAAVMIALLAAEPECRSEERRGGKGCDSKCRSRG